MEPWIPSLITGAFTLLAGWGGLAWSGRREKQNRQNDQERNDKNSQREAVARFLRASHDLDAQYLEDIRDIDRTRTPEKLTLSQVQDLRNIAAHYYLSLGKEIQILSLQVHEPFTRKQLYNFWKFVDYSLANMMAELDFYHENVDIPAEERWLETAKSAARGADIQGIVHHREAFVEVARVRLRLKSAGTDEHPPMFTPPS